MDAGTNPSTSTARRRTAALARGLFPMEKRSLRTPAHAPTGSTAPTQEPRGPRGRRGDDTPPGRRGRAKCARIGRQGRGRTREFRTCSRHAPTAPAQPLEAVAAPWPHRIQLAGGFGEGLCGPISGRQRWRQAGDSPAPAPEKTTTWRSCRRLVSPNGKEAGDSHFFVMDQALRLAQRGAFEGCRQTWLCTCANPWQRGGGGRLAMGCRRCAGLRDGASNGLATGAPGVLHAPTRRLWRHPRKRGGWMRVTCCFLSLKWVSPAHPRAWRQLDCEPSITCCFFDMFEQRRTGDRDGLSPRVAAAVAKMASAASLRRVRGVRRIPHTPYRAIRRIRRSGRCDTLALPFSRRAR